MTQGEPPPRSPRSRPTMREVAALAGVAIKTVSRVVNGVPTVDPAIAARVREAADKLGYRPNLTASSLRRGDGRTSMIGMLVEDAANPFSAALTRTVENVARERGVLVLVGSLDEDAERERELARALIDRRVDGLVIVPAGRDHSYLISEQRSGTRMVFVDREAGLLDADAVVSDNRQGAVTAVNHLLEAGHRRIAYLGDRASIPTAAQRFDGYRHALEVAHIAYDDEIARHAEASEQAAVTATEQLLSLPDPPTALFTSQNMVTIGAVRALRALGLQDTVAHVGFDDFPLADILNPGISVIAQDIEQMGKTAAEMLFSRLDGDESPTRTVTVPTRLIQRGSGEITAEGPRHD
ncbi:LacI family DNA-binding transcriptional regulator [Streptomyces sp. Li-HN-5-11]|uniref:LacI family DNA-binding transcriptional regulator n=1 Tax=Streptomyces sp. Li-HN-5-11 TaxID=3075432 RepID=UPI0028AD1886|nr:LacI family DNA-binding transcriptional regulator [Streptomyces sp. Li-HN-5-11]WNM35856.1 LacI family DNA-binding transcriptional regulator [Streptomyces sp. Li-HN-5-11]